MGGNFKTFVTDTGNPQLFLNKFFNEKAQTVLSKQLQIKPSILSIVVANSDATDVDLQIRVEPLNSSPLDSLYVEFIFRTTKYDVFSQFISNFGADFIKELIGNISEVQ